MKQIKGMIGLLAMTPIAGETLGQIGYYSSKMSGLGAATQTLVSTGFMGYAAKLSGAKKLFKW